MKLIIENNMKLKLTRSTQMWYTDNRTIDIEIPDGTEDVESLIKKYIEENEDEIEEEFFNVDIDDEFSDPDSVWYSIEGEMIDRIYWQD